MILSDKIRQFQYDVILPLFQQFAIGILNVGAKGTVIDTKI